MTKHVRYCIHRTQCLVLSCLSVYAVFKSVRSRLHTMQYHAVILTFDEQYISLSERNYTGLNTPCTRYNVDLIV